MPAFTKLWKLAADLNGDASRFECQLTFILNQKCTFLFLHCGEMREEKISDQLWDYSVINCIPFISELYTVRYWKLNYWLIYPDLNKVYTHF